MYGWLGAAAFAQFAAGVGKANAIKRSSYAEADVDEAYADAILRNHFSNVQRQRDNLYDFTTKRMDQGGQQLALAARTGDQAVGKVRTAEMCSTQDVQVEEAFDSWYNQQQVAMSTQTDVESATRGYNQWMEADYEQTMMSYNNLYASAKAKRSGADDMWGANIFSSLAGAGGTYAAGSTG